MCLPWHVRVPVCVQVVPGKALLQLASQRPDLALELGLRMSQGLKQQLGQLQAAQQVSGQHLPVHWWHMQALAPSCNAFKGSDILVTRWNIQSSQAAHVSITVKAM
jgi:hypothetical protein